MCRLYCIIQDKHNLLLVCRACSLSWHNSHQGKTKHSQLKAHSRLSGLGLLLCSQARMEARSAKRRRQVDLLYELWDVNASGYLELEEIQVVLNKWRSDGIEHFKEGRYD